MALCKAEAITLRLTDFSETSQVAWFYTREFGRLTALAKGAKRPRSNFEGPLDLLCHSQIVFARKTRTTLHILTECKLLDRFMGLRADASRLYAALYAAELARDITPIEESQPPIFDLLLGTLRALSDGLKVDAVLLIFEARLLALAGYAPRVDACVGCGAAELPSTSVRYSPPLGGALCPACRERDPKAAGVPRGALALLGRAAEGAAGAPSSLGLPPGMLVVLRKLMKTTFAHLLRHEPKLARYV